MTEDQSKIKGYVYILEVKDIDLPVCKIGRTSRNPSERCAEINNSSTGDFLWEVAYAIAVDDCKALESFIHRKLAPLRQKRREFFNLNVDDAYKAVRSIIGSQSIVTEIPAKEIIDASSANTGTTTTKKTRSKQFRKIDSQYTEVLQSFTSSLNIKGRPFGQLNKPVFGMSDGNEGVQWNIAVFTDADLIRVGVNLEGQQYVNWPITAFILSELENPSIETIAARLDDPDSVYVRFVRDAWQVQSRPNIVERYLHGEELPIREIDSTLWKCMLTEGLGCLSESKGYRGRNKQSVTLANQPKNGPRTRSMWVSPHLTIWTPINFSGDIGANLETGISRLQPVHEWISSASR